MAQALVFSECARVVDKIAGLGANWKENGYVAFPIVLVIILVTKLVWNAQIQAQRRKTLPPGPRPWPIFGNLTALVDDKPHRVLQDLAFKHGGLMYLQLGSVPCVVVSTAEAVREVFRFNDERILSRPKMLSFGIISDNYKSISFGPPVKLWQNFRKFCSTELFTNSRVASYQGRREEEIKHMLMILVEKAEHGRAVDLRSWLHDLSSNMTTRMLVNKRFLAKGGATDDQQEILKSDLEHVLEGFNVNIMRNVLSDYLPFLRYFSEELQGARAAVEAFRDEAAVVGAKIVELEKHRQRAQNLNQDENYIPDFVDVLLGARLDDGKGLSDTLLTVQVLEFFFAGTHTSSSTVEWAMAQLITNPDLMKRAQAEVDAVVPPNRYVRDSDISNLPYLQSIVKETFRMHPVLSLGGPRETTEPIEVMGYKIPAQTRLFVNIFAVHRDPAVYSNPETLDPDRFLTQHLQTNHCSGFDSYELIPFGVGRRMCPGFHLGNTLVHVMLANLLHRFHWSLPEGQTIATVQNSVMSEKLYGLLFHPNESLHLIPKLKNGLPTS